jgi:DNA primase
VTPVGEVLEKLGVPAERRGRRWWAEQCPLPSHGKPNPSHRHQNFFVRSEESEERPGAFYCFSCKGGGSLVQLVEELKGIGRDEARAWLAAIGDRPPPPVVRFRYETTGPRRFRLPEGVEFLPMRDWNSVARGYAESRGVAPEQVERWGIGVAHEGRLANRIVVPIRDWRGRLANYSARTFVDDPVRYLAASTRERPDLSAMWGEEQWSSSLDGRAVVLVVEGVLNGLAFERALPAGLVSFGALQGSDLDGEGGHRKLAKLATFAEVIVATDPDAPGRKAARQIASSLGRGGRRVVEFVWPDPRDACEHDPGFLLREVVRCRAAFPAAR